MKRYEAAETERRLMPGLPVMVRLDGRSFHTFTRGLALPIHEPLRMAMIETARFLVEESQASFAYTQSDEISLVFWNPDPESSMLFDARVQKLTSILASLATAKFNQEVQVRMPEKARLLPVFDARVFNLPNLEEVVNCMLFRTQDCAKNSVTMAAAAHYSHKQLHGKSTAVKHQMLEAAGVRWLDYPTYFRDGTFLRRELVSRHLTPQELARIPEKHRPTAAVQRSQVVEMALPPFGQLANPKEVLFDNATPVLRVPETA